MTQLFPEGFNGLANSKHSGVAGSLYRAVGIDAHSEPGLIKVNQKLTKDSGVVVDELCKEAISVSDGSKLWFSSESGKIWRESAGTYTLVYTTDTTGVSFFNDVLDTSTKTLDNTILLTDDTSLTNDALKQAQTVKFTSDTSFDQVEYYLQEIGGIDGSYDLKLSVQTNVNGKPNGTDLQTITQTVVSGDIQSDRHAPYTFTFDKTVNLDANTIYWLILEVVDYADVDAGEAISVSVSNEVEQDMSKFYVTEWSDVFESGDVLTTRLRLKRSTTRNSAVDTTVLTPTVPRTVRITSTYLGRVAGAVGQSFTTTVDTVVDTIAFTLSEAGALDGGYSLQASIQTNESNAPSGNILSSSTRVIGTGDINGTTEVSFTLDNEITLKAGVQYWAVLKPTLLSDIVKTTNADNLTVQAGEGTTAATSLLTGELLAFVDLNVSSTHALNLEESSSQSASITDASQTGLDITGDLSIEAEITLQAQLASNETDVIASKSQSDSNEMGYRFMIRDVGGTNYLSLGISSAGSSETIGQVPFFFFEDIKHHVACSYDASAGEVTFFINGVKYLTTQGSMPTSINDNASNFTVGADNFGASAAPDNFFDGQIDDLRVWNTERTESQILTNRGEDLTGTETGLVSLWKFNNNYTDSNSNGNDLTGVGTPTFAARNNTKWNIDGSSTGDLDGYDAIMKVFKTNIDATTVGEAKCLGAEEFDEYIYWATEKLINRIPVSKITTVNDWSDNAHVGFGQFDNGNASYHPMVLQNLQLFIGDGKGIAKIDEDGLFNSETEFLLKEPEVITAMTPFDIDVLVGTSIVGQNKARALRWNTEGESWSAEDYVEQRAVNAFIRDDNYVYIQAGDFGKIFFYNGEQMEDFKTIIGDYSPTAKAIVNSKSVTTLFGIPRFGFSNLTGNPALQGVYSLGSYSRDYPKILDLSFPISNDEFEDLEIGAILVEDGNMYTSWKHSGGVGVDKLDYTAKYGGAYMESMILTAAEERGVLKTLSELQANYETLPASTAVTFGVKKAYEANYVTQVSKDDTKLLQIRAEVTIPDVAAFQLKTALTASGNTAPSLENIDYQFQKIKR